MWIGGLPRETVEDDIECFLQRYGKIEDVQLRSSARDVFAFVTFEEKEEAQRAIRELDGEKFLDGSYRVKLALSNKTAERRRQQSGSSRQRSPSPRRRTRSRSQRRSRDDSRERRERSPSSESDDDKSLTAWLGGLPKGVKESEIDEFCKGFGKIEAIRIRSSGRDVFAFVTFEDGDLGKEAVDKLDQMQWRPNHENIIQVRVSNTKRPRRDKARYRTPSRHRDRDSTFRLEIRYLPQDMTWSELKDMARNFGDSVCFANVFVKSGVMCGVIDFRNRDDADNAYKKMNRKRVHGHDKRLEVTWG